MYTNKYLIELTDKLIQKTSRAKLILNSLIKQKIIKPIGQGHTTKYILDI